MLTSSEIKRKMSARTSLLSEQSSRTDLSKFGLDYQRLSSVSDAGDYKEDGVKDNELFNRDPERRKMPWWKMSFLMREKVLFNTWDGVFASCMINIFGVVIFLRTGWMVGFAGLGFALLIIILTILIALIAVLSAIGVCERCQIESGGVYFLVSHVLGSRIASSVGFLYCFGQAIASSLYAVGFGESISNLIGYTNPWFPKLIAVSALIVLLGVNLIGVKWVVRLQIILLLIIFISVLDFFVGSFIKTTPSLGVIGYGIDTFRNNTYSHFTSENSFFTIFGVFFPTVTGVCAGINMSGELRKPKESIPTGTLSAIGVSFFLYICFAFILAGTCTPYALQTDNLITVKVAFFGPLLLTGLYVSSLSAALGGMSTAPRLLKVISETTKLPGTGFMAKQFGDNNVPIFSILLVATITISFTFIGDLNILATIVTIPFLLTYATLSYAYFVLAKSFDIQRKREEIYRIIVHSKESKYMNSSKPCGIHTSKDKQIHSSNDSMSSKLQNGSLEKECSLCDEYNELDRLFPERMSYGSTEENSSGRFCGKTKQDIIKQPTSCYSIFINRWISLAGTVLFIGLMFGVEWRYSLIAVGVWMILYFYIGIVCPGLFPGVSEFSLFTSLIGIPGTIRLGKEKKPENELLITTKMPKIVTESIHITDESEDYQSRDRYHSAQLYTLGSR